jgi:hypothetical protein
LEKVEWLVEEEMQDRVLREWKMIESIKREARLIFIISGEFFVVTLVLFEEEDDVTKEMREEDKGNQQQREKEFFFPCAHFE